MIHAWTECLGITQVAIVVTAPLSPKIWFTEWTSAGYKYSYNESPNSAFLEPLKTIYSPCCRCSYAALRPHYMRNTSRMLVISLLFTILNSSEGKNHEDPNPNYGLA